MQICFIIFYSLFIQIKVEISPICFTFYVNGNWVFGDVSIIKNFNYLSFCIVKAITEARGCKFNSRDIENMRQ